MLRSEHIKLIGAFDHRHIFVDPDPDPAASFAERARMFKLPRSSWADYDSKLISEGGGIFDRKAKSIKISPRMKALFDIAADQLTPFELMKAMLKARVDLLWFGGIGNYIKAASETNADAGDRANDAIRVNGGEIRARAIGEGANLGATQRGRIEYAMSGAGGGGGKINTDAIDNSAGVDTSDHEVNIKILLGDVIARGDMTLKQRDALLAQMTEDVGGAVLRNNYLQTQALSLTELEGAAGVDRAARLMRALEKTKRLDRGIEFLPDDDALAQRASSGKGLTRPELAVVMAYAKMALYDDLLAGDLPDDPSLVGDLVKYFPRKLRKGHKQAILRHRLRREIIATLAANSIVNRAGYAFVHELVERLGASQADAARAYIAVRGIFGLREYWGAIETLDNKAPAAVQLAMLRASGALIERASIWLLRHVPGPFDVASVAAEFGPGIDALAKSLDEALDPARKAALDARAAALAAQSVPDALARKAAALDDLQSALDLVRIARAGKADIQAVAKAYFAAGAKLGFDWLHEAASRAPARDALAKRAIAAAVDDFYALQAEIAAAALAAGGIDAWLAARKGPAARWDALAAELRAAPGPSLAALAVAGRELRALAQG
jgi:glutamate dehydrogenase